MLNDFVGKKRNETNVFQLCCGQRAYVGLVGGTLTLKITLKWLQGCQLKQTKNEYFVNQTKDRSNKRSNKKWLFCKSNKRSYGVYKQISKCNVKLPNWLKSNPVVPLQTNPLVFSNVRRKSVSLFVIELAVPRLIGLVLRREPDRLVPEVFSGIWRDHSFGES